MATGLVRDRFVRNSCGFRIVGSLALLALFFAPALAPIPTAQAQKTVKLARRILLNVTPDYPVSLRAAHVGGLVRLSVTVSPSGNVTKIDVLGGNAIFCESATKAVKMWKYAPAAAETTNEVEIRFNPDSPEKP